MSSHASATRRSFDVSNPRHVQKLLRDSRNLNERIIVESVCIMKSGCFDILQDGYSSSSSSGSDDLYLNEQDNEDMVLRNVGRFPLKKLEISFGAHVLPAQDLATAIRETESTLEELKLTCLLFGGESQALLEAIRRHPSLKAVHLRQIRSNDNDASARGLRDFICALAACPHLKQVELEEIYISDRGTEMGQALTQLCQQSTSLESLTANSCAFLKDEQIIPIFETLKTNNTLKHITIASRYREIGVLGIQAISDALIANSTIETLTLHSDGSILEPIAKALTCNRTLKRLRLNTWPRAKLFSDITSSFVSMARDNYVLEYLDGYAGQWLYPDLQFYLKLNRDGPRRHLMESGTATRTDWIRAIISNQDDTSFVYYFLSMNPVLCQPLPTSDDDIYNNGRPTKRQKIALC